MSQDSHHNIHENHSHAHGADCGHKKITHNGHTDYLHDGHLHSQHEGHFDEHAIEVNANNPDKCTPSHSCSGHDANHEHGAKCGHEGVPHGNHTDYLVEGHLHHSHGDHCDDHGKLSIS